MELGPAISSLLASSRPVDGFVNAVDGVNLKDSQRRLLLPARTIGLRQDHDPADDRGA